MLNKLIKGWCERIMRSRAPDVVIGDPDDPYLLRWWVWPRNKWLNLYLHRVLRSDDDRALHDHPWINMSYIVDGGYNEVTFDGPLYDPTHGELPAQTRTYRGAGEFKFRKPTALHRLELIEDVHPVYAGHGNVIEELVPREALTLFLTGPRVRTWGFRCPKGWVKWTDFTQKTPEGTFIAKGCGDIDPQLLAPTAAKSGFWPKPPDGVSEPSKGQTPRDTAARAGSVKRD